METKCSPGSTTFLRTMKMMVVVVVVLQTLVSASSNQRFCPSVRVLKTWTRCHYCRIGFQAPCPVDFKISPKCPDRHDQPCSNNECTCVHGLCNSGLLGDGTCTCFSGYKGSNCDQAVNPCLQAAPCHAHAVCTHTGPNKHICACTPGYRWRRPLDPCQVNQAGCSADTTMCVYDGPGASHCECLPGFHQLDSVLSCRLQDVCKPDSCHQKANCTTVQPGVTQCTCPDGYLGNGKVCYGDIMERLTDLNTEPGGRWTGSVSWPLHHLGPFTLFVPIDRAFRFTPVKTIMANPQRASYLLKLHMVAGTMPQDSLRRADVFYTLTGKAGEDLQTSVRLRGSKRKVGIVQADVVASNGMMHLVNKLMENITPTVDSDTQTANLASVMDAPGPYTVFAPTNEAWDALPEGHLDHLTSEQGRNKLLELLRNHVVDSARLNIFNLVSSPSVVSMANQLLFFNVSENGRVFVNGMTVLEANVETRNGLLYSLDGALVPASILPLLPHRCDATTVKVVEDQCMSCGKAVTTRCLTGAYVGSKYGCVYRHTIRSVTFPVRGCGQLCNTTITTAMCCAGFYGAQCTPCPGGFQNPCSGHGQCMEGMEGNGTCICQSGFSGSRCQYCSLPNKYGPNCDRNCDFNQGAAKCVCKPGYQGDGIVCFERDPCARNRCGKNAKCIKTGPNAHVCQCLAGWTLDGDECQPINDCNSPRRGGCHANASCIYIGPGQSDCICKPGYQGNGIDCEPANQCLVQNGGGCHYLAMCQFVSGQWRCVCEDGYVGDGQVCYGTVEQELITLPDASEFLTWVSDAGLSQSLSDQNITLLVPTSAAIKALAEDDQTFWTAKGNLPSIVRNHVIQGAYRLSSLKASTSPLSSLLNNSLPVVSTSSNAVLVPARRSSEGLLEVPGAETRQHNLTDQIEQAGEYTVFAPTDSAAAGRRMETAMRGLLATSWAPSPRRERAGRRAARHSDRDD
ncbi:hypothetical protein CRUP_025343 [Coryphaenoides rupestris]|nr:hypothetical protein CRUP_025343 [Coryphaenoides rupestris]